MSPGSHTKVLRSLDATFRMRRVGEDGKEGAPRVLPGSAGPYLGTTSVTADGNVLAAVRKDGTAELWSLSGEPRRTGTVASAGDATASPALSADGRLLAVAGADGVQVWGVRDAVPTLLGQTSGHGAAQLVSFLPKGERLLVSDAASARLWDTRAPIRPGTLGGDLYGLIAEVGAAGLIALGAVVQSWIRLRAGRFKVSWEKDREGGRTVVSVDGTNASGAASARALLDEIARAVESEENARRALPPSSDPDGPADDRDRPGSTS